MATDIKGRAIIAQSGGPTAVINASACGVIQTALAHPKTFTGVYGAHNGILGVLREELFDLGSERPEAIEALRWTPAAALGSCRYKLKSLEKDRADYERIVEVFKAHEIRFFFYAGGNDSMDTADKVARLAADMKYDLIVVGVPKTVDNDLAETDHCPGYGSVAKYLATSVMEAGKDTEALYTTDTCTIVECMGRNAGWIAASTGLASRCEEDAPHLIYLPEFPFSVDRFVADVKDCVKRLGLCVIAVGEGLQDADGKPIAAASGQFAKDAFGHVQLGGVAESLRVVVEAEVGIKARTNKAGTFQRAAMHWASRTDSDEAYRVGQAAVEAALAGTSRKMVTLVRQGSGAADYGCTTGLADLSVVANGEKPLPRAFVNEAANHVTDAFREYALPLVRGETPVELAPDGLPVFVRLRKQAVSQRTGRPYSTR
ncbi:MAG: 6-phosphofructokinase [Phycisphaerae bacterium]|nr:6-phosphofructokinase [Phycisphaerae bacterium]